MNMAQTLTTGVGVVSSIGSIPIVAVGLNWAVLLPLIFAGIALLINTSVSAWQSVRMQRDVRATKDFLDQNAKTGAVAASARDAKLDNITVLVDGRYSLVLQELADVKRLLAVSTGLVRDHANAETAQGLANEQAGRVLAASLVKPVMEVV